MPIVFLCANCRAPLAFADNQAGERFHCPRCGLAVQVPDASTSEAEQIVAGEPPLWPSTPSLPPVPSNTSEQVSQRPLSKPPTTDDFPAASGWDPEHDIRSMTLEWLDPRPDPSLIQDPHAWRLVRLGLTLHYSGITAALTIVLFGFGWMMCLIFAPPAIFQWLELLWFGFLGTIGASLMLACVGQCMCCAAPATSGVRGYAIGSAICLVINVMATTAYFLLSLPTFDGDMLLPVPRQERMVIYVMMSLLIVGATVVGHWLFVTFLRQTAQDFRNRTVAESARSYLGLFTLFCVVYVILFFGPFLFWRQLLGLFFCFGFFELVIGLMLLVWYLRLVKLTRDSIAFWTSD